MMKTTTNNNNTNTSIVVVVLGQCQGVLRLVLAASILILTTVTFLLLATPQCLLVHVVEQHEDYDHDGGDYHHHHHHLAPPPLPVPLAEQRQIRQRQSAQQPAVLLAPTTRRIRSQHTVREQEEVEEAWEYKYYSPDNNDKIDMSVFDSALHPVLDVSQIIQSKLGVNKERKIRTRLFTIPNHDGGILKNEPSNEGKQILYDGLQQSSFIDLVDVVYMHGPDIMGSDILNNSNNAASIMNNNDDDLWVLDMHHILQGSGQAKGKKRTECETLVRLIDQAMIGRNNSGNDQEQPQQQLPLKILAIDYADNRQVLHCPSVMKRIGMENYHLAKRSIVTNRQWNEVQQFPTSGNLMDATTVVANNNMHHIPYGVRTDLAQQVAHRTVHHFQVESPLHTDRSAYDVIHLYERTWDNGKGAYYDNLRTSINAALKFINGTQIVVTAADDGNNNNSGKSSSSSTVGRPLMTFTGKVGLDQNEGRNFVSNEYVDLMLSSKIHVVAQRDAWTDHYRLMEALTGASLVLADESIVLAKGLKTGHSLVTYNSLPDLREKILYYLEHEQERLAIAQRGWEIAMGYHRSWHVMEAAIFGQPQTLVGQAHEIFQRDVQNAATAAVAAAVKTAR